MSQVEHDVDGDEEEIQYVAVEDDPEGQDVDENEDQEEEEREEQRLGGGREDDEDDDDDKRARRREENKSRRQRQREARARTERELKFLRDRNETLERRFSALEAEVDQRVTGSELTTIDQNISKAKSDLQLANQVIETAVEQNDGKNLAEALEHRDTIRDNLKDLQDAREYLTNEDRRPAPGPARLDPRHQAYADNFMMEHDWWDPMGSDEDSQRVLMIDAGLVREGFDPRTKEYWDELRTRTHTALPHRFDDAGGGEDLDDDDQDTGDTGGNGKDNRQRGPQFRTGGRERPLKPNEVYISPERKEAMIEAGIWDDPVARNNMLKRYADYDRDAAEQQAGR